MEEVEHQKLLKRIDTLEGEIQTAKNEVNRKKMELSRQIEREYNNLDEQLRGFIIPREEHIETLRTVLGIKDKVEENAEVK